MKIIHVISDLSYGGIPRICVDLCNYLSEKEDVYLITLCGYGEGMLPLSCLDHDIQLISFNKKKGLNLSLIWQTYSTLRRLNPDVVHTHSIGLFYSILFIITFPRTKAFYTVHSLADKDAPWYYRFFYKILFRFFKVRPIPISEAVRRSIRHYYKVKGESVIYHGVNISLIKSTSKTVINEIETYKATGSSKVFVNLARIAEEKNQYMLIEAFNRLTDEQFDVILLIIGSAKENSLLNKLKNIAGPNIYFLGAKDNIGDYLKIADGFCLTSKFEGLSLATIEALSMKVIPICTPVGGVPEVVRDGDNGLLSEECTLDSYSEAIKRFLTMSCREKEAMRYNAFNTFKERFTIEKCGEGHLALYHRVLKGGMK